jgi:PAS domain S-box-containing protein
MHILLIDDDPNDRVLVSRLIKHDHPEAEILQVENAADLARSLAHNHIDLAIVDYSLGWSNGLEVFQRVKAAYPDCSAIMYSGAAGEDYAVEAIKAGLDDYIVKEISRQPRLRTSIRALLAHGEQRHQLRLSQQRYEELFQRVTVGLFECTSDGKFEDANPALLSILGVGNLTQLSGHGFFDIFSGVMLPESLSVLPHDGISDIQVRVRRNDGQEFAGLLNAYPSREGEDRIQGVLTNVTALQKALDDKTVLLREVYHRVYNNLQLVISLLGMQSRHFESEEVRAGFRQVMDRVRSLSLVQQKLHRTEQYSAVDFSSYLRDLASSLVPPAKAPDISIVFELDPIELTIDQAVPLGLIANELLMNAIKHAFPDRRKGEIRIKLAKRPGCRAAFSISDTGVGMGTTDMSQSRGVGGRLIQQLAQQADAKVTMKSAGGFAAEVEFQYGEP